MKTLSPAIAANFAAIAYELLDKQPLIATNPYVERVNSLFTLESEPVQGVSGSVLERMFNHKTEFGCIAKGKKGLFEGDYVLALRGTAKMRDVITDLNCGLSTCSNSQPVHAGFNHTFNSFRKQLEQFFSKKASKKLNIHVVGHSLGGALANLAANWLKNHFGANVKLYTFGAPRVGYHSFAIQTEAATNNHVYRCVHAADPVPLVPVWPFMHTEQEYILNGAATITPKAHSMTDQTPGYLHTASNFKSYAAINKGMEKRIQEEVRLDYDKRLECSRTSRWARKIGAALITYLRDTGKLYAIQNHYTNTLTVYDQIAKALTDSIDLSKNYTSDVKGILGYMLAFCGYPFKAISFTYASIRHILKLMLKNVFSLAGQAIALTK
ncbi:lipase family protein [Pseudoalteromonas sp. CF6-2]|uniref:lipase family protein n=2 Tax=unclassified Pseudoalteromonas TaxID=194690 RepID=UPI001F399833|nr:lipase family protein [Pseudoalteromonas sp. CF6-2]